MSAWVLKENAQTWDSVFDHAWAGEPQFVSRDGSRTVVVISLHAYETAYPQGRQQTRDLSSSYTDIFGVVKDEIDPNAPHDMVSIRRNIAKRRRDFAR